MCVDDNVMTACFRATVIVVFALFAFAIGYLVTKNKYKQPQRVEPLSNVAIKKILKMSYFFFGVCYLLSVYYAMSSGKTIIGILSLGTMGQAMYMEDNMQFMINISYSMLVPWLFIFTYSTNKIIPTILSYLLINLRLFNF